MLIDVLFNLRFAGAIFLSHKRVCFVQYALFVFSKNRAIKSKRSNFIGLRVIERNHLRDQKNIRLTEIFDCSSYKDCCSLKNGL